MPSIELPRRVKKEAPYLTREELKLALGSADPRLYRFIMVAYYTAGRRESIERLTPSQIDLEQKRINLRRPDETDLQQNSTKRRPIVPLNTELRPVLAELLIENQTTGWLFGKDVDFYASFRKLMIRIGLAHKANPHILRHSRATHLLQQGVSIYLVAKLLGDSVLTVERVYGHHCPDYLGETLEGR